jgi:hypothetical protein
MTGRRDLKKALGALLPSADVPPGDPADDLARARAALRLRRRRRFQLGLGGAVAVALLGVGTVTLLAPDAERQPASIHLIAKTLDADPYTFDLTPSGWSVESQSPTAVTIVPDDGSQDSGPYVFTGKLVILFDRNHVSGIAVDHGGRTIWVGGDSGYTIMSTRTRGDEPRGVVRIQYPDDTGWSRAAMLDFLASVHVGPGARPGLG